MKHLKRFNESVSLEDLTPDFLKDILIDIIDEGFRVTGPYNLLYGSGVQFEIDRYCDDDWEELSDEDEDCIFNLSDISESLIKLENYTGLKFKYYFEDDNGISTEYDDLHDMLDSYDDNLLKLVVIVK